MRRLLEFGRRSLAVICCGLAATASAKAQKQGGLYGATQSGGGRDQFNIEAWFSEAFTRGLPQAFQPGIPVDQVQAAGPSTIFGASGDYARVRHSVQLFGTFSTYARYGGDGGIDRLSPVSDHGAVGAGFRLPNGGTLTITQAATYSPAYLYELFPTAAPSALGGAAPVSPTYQTDSSVYRTSAAVAFGSARGTQVTTTADYSLTNFHQQAAGALDFATYGVGARLSRALSRSSGISAGYTYQTGDFTLGGVTKEHRFTIGANYSPALSRTRRVMLRLDLSPSVLESPAASGSIERQSHFQGEAAVGYPFRPKWRAELSYRRAVDYVVGLTEPTLTSGTRIEVTGIIAHRFDLTAMAGYATGSSAISAHYQNLGTSTGQVRLRYALNRNYALYSEYLFSSYDLRHRQQIGLESNLPGLSRVHEFRVGFTAFVPVLGR